MRGLYDVYAQGEIYIGCPSKPAYCQLPFLNILLVYSASWLISFLGYLIPLCYDKYEVSCPIGDIMQSISKLHESTL